MVVRWLVVFAKALHAGGGHGVESGGLQINFKPIYRGHVAVIDWATCRHSIHCKQAMSPANFPNSFLPRVVWPATSASVRTVRIVQSTSLFLPVCHLEQNAISLAPDVHLNPNELHWVCNDEAYAPVRFEAIPSTLNF
jgi:hypothetical protein